MKAIVYNGPRDVSVQYEGRTSMETGRVFGHENLGEVIEVGAGVDRVKVGDRVCLPFNFGVR